MHYFKNILKLKNQHKRFTSPSQLIKVMMKIKLSVSHCLLDQISVITVKKCPVLHSCLTNILQKAWTAKTFLDVWKSWVMVLAYEKGDGGNPESFYSITILQPVLSKVFTQQTFVGFQDLFKTCLEDKLSTS